MLSNFVPVHSCLKYLPQSSYLESSIWAHLSLTPQQPFLQSQIHCLNCRPVVDARTHIHTHAHSSPHPFYFCLSGQWTQNLILARQVLYYWAISPAYPVLFGLIWKFLGIIYVTNQYSDKVSIVVHTFQTVSLMETFIILVWHKGMLLRSRH